MEKWKCLICGKEMHKAGIINHLTKTHKMQPLDYFKNNDVSLKVEVGKHSIFLKKDFSGICNLCGNDFSLHCGEPNEFLLGKCSTNCGGNLSKHVSTKYKRIFSIDESSRLYKDYKKLNKSNYFSKEKCFRELGKMKGQEKLNEVLLKTSQSKEGFILRYGLEEGVKRFKEFCEKSALTLDNFIKRHGTEKGTLKWKRHCLQKKYSSPRNIMYWLDFYSGDYILAQQALKQYQGKSKKFYVEKYGQEKADEMMRSKTVNALKSIKTGRSKMSKACFGSIIKDNSILDSMTLFYAESEKMFKLGDVWRKPDFYVEDLNIVIEFNGDYWHANPKMYFAEDLFKDISAKEVWDRDFRRKKLFEEFLTKEIYTIWEYDWIHNPEEILKNVKGFLNARISRNK